MAIYVLGVLAILYGIVNACKVSKISMFDNSLSARQSLSNDTLIDKIPQI